MWHFGLVFSELCTFLAQHGSFLGFWCNNSRERVLRGVDEKSRISSTCLDAFRKRVFYSDWLWLEPQKAPRVRRKFLDVPGFQVGMLICHVVPVSRAYWVGGCVGVRDW